MADDQKTQNDVGGDDVGFEPETDSDNAEDTAELIKALKEKLKTSQKERQEYLEGWQRAKADYANLQKDEEKSRSEFAKFAKEGIIAELLPALDSFHIAFGNKTAWEKVDLNWRMGVQHIYTQLLSVLEKNGIQVTNPVGEKFNPKEHIAAGSIPTAEKEKDELITEVIQKGYTLYGKIIQPAKVMVAEYQEAQA